MNTHVAKAYIEGIPSGNYRVDSVEVLYVNEAGQVARIAVSYNRLMAGFAMIANPPTEEAADAACNQANTNFQFALSAAMSLPTTDEE